MQKRTKLGLLLRLVPSWCLLGTILVARPAPGVDAGPVENADDLLRVALRSPAERRGDYDALTARWLVSAFDSFGPNRASASNAEVKATANSAIPAKATLFDFII